VASIVQSIQKSLIKKGNFEIAEHSKSFFKTGPGEYGEGDKFIGLRVPILRETVKQHRDKLALEEIVEILHSEWHEVRLFALFAMVDYYQRASEKDQKRTVVAWHHDKTRAPVDKLLNAKLLWSRRIAMMSTFYHIRQHDLDDTYRYAEALLGDKEDLMHKVSGWMLREAGKRDTKRLETFLHKHAPTMPRTMLRYAIEKLPPAKRKLLLSVKTSAD